MMRGHLHVAALCLCVVAAAEGLAQDVAGRVSERSVKAAFLYKFAGYVQWPDADAKTDSPITIGVIGANDFARELAEITASRTISSRPINIRRLTTVNSLDGLDILFVAREERDHLSQLLAAARDKPILTVTESEGALSSGSIINFTLDQDRVRFEVSLYAAEKSQLRLNARLLAVAQDVHRGPEPQR
jgi:hypothetical protein